MLYSSMSEYEAAISETQAAISRCLTAGQGRTVGTGSANRSTTEVELSALRSHLQLLRQEKQCLEESGGSPGLGGFSVGAGW